MPSFTRIVKLSAGLSLIAACSRAGGPQQGTFTPLTNGFGYVATVHGFTDRSLTAGLWYKDPAGKLIRVWPYLDLLDGSSENPVTEGNIALLVGGKSELYDDGVERLTKRLIAFEAPGGPPLDVTDQIFARWCATNGLTLTNILKDGIAALNSTNDGARIEFVTIKKFPDKTDVNGRVAVVSWAELKSIIADLKSNGKTNVEASSGIQYLQK